MASRMTTDRRRAPRVKMALPLTVTGQGKAFLVQTKNLSATGAYCAFRQFVSPMTKLRVRVEVTTGSHPRIISCEGVVVRVDPPKPSRDQKHYDVAIFFHDLADDDRFSLARYVQEHLKPISSDE